MRRLSTELVATASAPLGRLYLHTPLEGGLEELRELQQIRSASRPVPLAGL
jgi:hypothetical protein